MVLWAAEIRGQEKPAAKPGDEMIEKYLAQETAKLSGRFLDGAKTRAEWEARLPRLRQEYLYMLGLWPLPEKTPLQAKVTGTLERDDFMVEKLHFQSRPGLYVTGNLYRPKKVAGKLPAVLYVCGHSGRGRNGNKTAFQDHGMWFASNGYICLVIDTLQLGEIPGIHHGTYNQNRWWWQAAGYTPAGVECWNGIRAIDYLVSRPDVDGERIAVTGISGGGASTIWISAADERVKCAVPVSGMSDLESYVTNKVINGHCDCMFLINTYGWEWTTIAALIAPRPMLFANSDNDRIFPMDGNRRIIARLRQLYKMYDKPELVDDYVSAGGHDYRPDLRVAIFKWINKHLKNDTGPVKDAEFKLFPNEQLRVFAEDKDVPTDAINGKIDETFVPRSAVVLPEAGKFEEWKQGIIKQLREKSFRAFPERIPAAINENTIDGMATLATEINVKSMAQVLQEGKDRATLIVINQDEVVSLDEKTFKGLLKSSLKFVGKEDCGVWVFPRGISWGEFGTGWTKKSPPNYVERSHALLGRTVDQGRVWDICAQVGWLNKMGAKENQKNQFKLVGRGQAGILAAYAALFEPSISEVVIIDPPVSHRDGPYFLNVLRVLDIPDALGLLAPRPLTLVNAKDKAFDRTAEIYKRAGAADKLQRK
jgi:cephalosporin-C deacetylase-like acetyl esterase